MKPDCSTCSHWQPKTNGARADSLSIGECRAQPPGRDFTWPRTKANDHCAQHASNKTATTASTTTNRKPKLAPKTDDLPLKNS